MANCNPTKATTHSLLAVFNHTTFAMVIVTSSYIRLLASHILTVIAANIASITTTTTTIAMAAVMDTLMDSEHLLSIH